MSFPTGDLGENVSAANSLDYILKTNHESKVYYPATAQFTTSHSNNPVSRYKTVVFTGNNIFQLGYRFLVSHRLHLNAPQHYFRHCSSNWVFPWVFRKLDMFPSSRIRVGLRHFRAQCRNKYVGPIYALLETENAHAAM